MLAFLLAMAIGLSTSALIVVLTALLGVILVVGGAGMCVIFLAVVLVEVVLDGR